MFKFLRRKSIPESPYQVLIRQIRGINTDKSVNVFSPDNSIISIRTYYRNIQECHLYLKRIVKLSSNEKELPDTLFRFQLQTYYLRDWFIDSNNCYLDVKSELEQFKERSIAFIQLFEQRELGTDTRWVHRAQPIISHITGVKEVLHAILGSQDTGSTDSPSSLTKPEDL